MRGPPDSHPDLHRRLALYHFRKWISPAAKIPMPHKMSRTISNHYAPTKKARARFHDPLHILAHDLPIGQRPWELLEDMRYYSVLLHKVIRVPKGYRTDFASVPRFFWRIIPPYGRYAKAAVVHDWLCELAGSTGIDSKTTHRIFLEAMEVLQVPWWKRKVMYYAVRWFGPRFRAEKLKTEN